MSKKVLFLLILILGAAFFVRVYRLDQLLGFYYDQGRDGLVIWRLLSEGKFFLIGPTTGIEGIFRGPWYYWLITPAYFFGGGNPVWPAVFLAMTTIAALAILFYLALKIQGMTSAFVAVLIGGFSYFLIMASRWLSNPTPMMLISMLLVLGMFLVIEGKRWAWMLIAITLGLAMQFGSAAEVFYFPAIGLFALWLLRARQKEKLPDKKILLFSSLLLIITFLPQIIFDIRHKGILLSGIAKFLIQEESFKLSLWEVAKIRFPFYYQVFFSKLFPTATHLWAPVALLALLSILLNLKNIVSNKRILVVFLLFITPIIGMLFFRGNYGNVYDYYFTGYYLIFILLFSTLFGLLVKKTQGLVIIILFFAFFFQDNLPLINRYLKTDISRETNISLGNSRQAVDWVFDDAEGEPFNADVYVPPVIPYAYDYLFLWQGKERCGETLCNMRLGEQIPLLYTLYEADPPHPERLDAWLGRQTGIGKVEASVRFGGITVERRERIK